MEMDRFESLFLVILLASTLAGVEGCGESSSPGTFEPGGSGATATGGASGGGAGGSGGAGGGAAGQSGAGAGSGTGGGASGGDPCDSFDQIDPSGIAPGSICDLLAAIQCAGEACCCDDPGRDFDTCKQTMANGCSNDLMLDRISTNPKIGFNTEFARNAFDEYKTKARACDPSIVTWGTSLQGLRGIITGTIAPLQACNSDSLAPEDLVAAAASCSDPANYACLSSGGLIGSIMWSCDPLSAAGGRCFSEANCQAGLYCPNPDLDPIGSYYCTQRKVDGTVCELPNECASLVCKQGQCVAAEVQAVYCLKDN